MLIGDRYPVAGTQAVSHPDLYYLLGKGHVPGP